MNDKDLAEFIIDIASKNPRFEDFKVRIMQLIFKKPVYKTKTMRKTFNSQNCVVQRKE